MKRRDFFKAAAALPAVSLLPDRAHVAKVSQVPTEPLEFLRSDRVFSQRLLFNSNDWAQVNVGGSTHFIPIWK